MLNETFRYRLEEYRTTWMDALSAAGSDPVDRIVAVVFASLDPRLLTHQNLAFWNSFWPDASRNVNLNEVSEKYDAERQVVLESLCEDAKDLLANTIWTPRTLAHALETITDGIWSRLYYSPNYMSDKEASIAVGTLLSTVFPSRAEDIMKQANNP
jgi:hypothetical protein